jgi:hypothetical protein
MQIHKDSVRLAPPLGSVLPPPSRQHALIEPPREPQLFEHTLGRFDIARPDEEVAIGIRACPLVVVEPTRDRRPLQKDTGRSDRVKATKDLGRGGVDAKLVRNGGDSRVTIGIT